MSPNSVSCPETAQLSRVLVATVVVLAAIAVCDSVFVSPASFCIPALLAALLGCWTVTAQASAVTAQVWGCWIVIA